MKAYFYAHLKSTPLYKSQIFLEALFTFSMMKKPDKKINGIAHATKNNMVRHSGSAGVFGGGVKP